MYLLSNNSITLKCKYKDICPFANSTECIDNVLGCLKIHQASINMKKEDKNNKNEKNSQ